MQKSYIWEKKKKEKKGQTGNHVIYIKQKTAMYILLIILIVMDIGFLGTIIANMHVYATYSKSQIVL